MSLVKAGKAGAQVSWFAEAGHTAIVIGGCARSGTTLLSTMLSAHSRIHLYRTGEFERESGVFPGEEKLIGTRLAEMLVADPPSPAASHWCEKTPRNVLHVRRVLEYFGPDSSFLHVVRDGRDVVSSVHPSRPGRYWVGPRRWVHDVSAGRSCEGMPGFLTIRYEDLVENPRATLAAVCEFVGLPFEDSLLRYPEAASVRKSGAWVGNEAEPLRASGIGRWREERHGDAARALVSHSGAVELLEAYGYL